MQLVSKYTDNTPIKYTTALNHVRVQSARCVLLQLDQYDRNFAIFTFPPQCTPPRPFSRVYNRAIDRDTTCAFRITGRALTDR